MRVIMLGCGASAGVPLIGGRGRRRRMGRVRPGRAAQPAHPRPASSIESGRRRAAAGRYPPDLRAQLLACRVSRRIDAILFTHAHADHITGLDDVRMLNRIVGRPLDAFATPETLAELSRRFDYAFQPWQPPGFFRPVLVPRTIAAWGDRRGGRNAGPVFDQDHGFIDTLGLRIGGFGYSTDVVEPG